MKFLLFRTEPKHPKKKSELVGVEYAKTIHDAMDALIRDINDDLAAQPENRHCEIHSYAPDSLGGTIKEMQEETVPGTQYEFTGVVSLVYASSNTLYPYIVEVHNES